MAENPPSPTDKPFAARLAELHAAATPGPWNWPFDGDVQRDHRTPDADLLTYLRNHTEAILALVEAAEAWVEAYDDVKYTDAEGDAKDKTAAALEALNRG